MGEEIVLPAIQPSYLCEKELFITSSTTQMAIMQAFLSFSRLNKPKFCVNYPSNYQV